MLDKLVEAGLLQVDGIPDPTNNPRDRTEVMMTYQLTTQGKAKLIKTPGGYNYLPYCEMAVQSIESYTEPSAEQGMTVTLIDFTYRIKKVEDWAKSLDPQLFPDVAEMIAKIDQPIPQRARLVLTSEGWAPPR